MSLVPVGNAGNAADGRTGYGAVAEDYYIGAYEVTNWQWAEFLNTVDSTGANALNLWFSQMETSARGGINFVAGNANGSKYVVKSNFDNKPVNYISWLDAARFTNWLHNGQGSGDTEDGAYTLNGNSHVPRNVDAQYWIPSIDEWYKAAFYDPSLNGGTGGYWDYATQSNSDPTVATHDAAGNITNGGANVANYGGGAAWNGLANGGNVTTVGSAQSVSAYGTYDQSGNVWEWNEDYWGTTSVDLAAQRGGGFNLSPAQAFALSYSHQNSNAVTIDSANMGFRIASAVPEPSTVVLAVMGGLGVLLMGWRKRRSE